MGSDEEDSPYLRVKTRSKEDTLFSTTINDTLRLRLFSARCWESRSQDLSNQDYAQLHVRRDGSSLCFCVCDGVGSSYRGDFAARFLGARLVEWLQKVAVSAWPSQATEVRLRTQLMKWAQEAQTVLQREGLSPETPLLVREVLEELRDTYGSETVFLGGVINLAPWTTQLKRSLPRETFFCWMGNVTARLFVTEDHSLVLGGKETEESGWSTVQGLCGALSIQQIGLTTLHRLMVHTDGLDALGATLPDLDDRALQEQARLLLRRPESDDMTLLDLRWIVQDREEKGT
jgi:hypothetical protein